MFDKEQLRKSLAIGSKFDSLGGSRQRDYTYVVARPKDFDNGKYEGRVCPTHPQKNPHGYKILSTHDLCVEPGKTFIVLAAESYANQEEASPFIYSILKVIVDNDFVNHPEMPRDLLKVLAKLKPWRRLMVPCLFWCERYEKGTWTDKEGETHPNYRYKPGTPKTHEPIPVIWEFSARTLIEKFLDMVDECPQMSHPTLGQNFIFEKKGMKYDLRLRQGKTPLDPRAKPFLEDDPYPNLLEWGKWFQKSHEEIVAACQGAWWAPLMEKFVELTDDGTSWDDLEVELSSLEEVDREPEEALA